jgi:hypothetical protein
MKIYIRHLRMAGMCPKAKEYFFERYGFDWKDFVRNGIDIEKVRHIDDAMVKQVIKVAENERR